MLSRLLLAESGLISLIGALIGAGLAALIILPFLGMIRESLKLPMLLPSVPVILALLAGSIVISTAAGSLTSAVSARKITRTDAGLILREDT